MNMTNENSTRSWKWKTVALTVTALIVGGLIGAAVASRAGRLSVAATTPAASSKVAMSPAARSAPTQPSTAGQPTVEDWNPFQEIRNMQAEMNQMFQRSIDEFNLNPQMDIFKREPGYSSSLKVQDLKDRYEVHVYLPNSDASNANVKLRGNQLTVDISNHESQQEKSKNANTSTESWGSYDQVVTLAGDLKPDGMKVEHHQHELLITIPKANS